MILGLYQIYDSRSRQLDLTFCTMASIPTPRSFAQTYGDMLSGLLSRLGVTVRPVSPLDAVFIAVAQSEVRATQDVMGALNANSLSRARGTALDRTGADEDLPRQTQTLASGPVSFGDSRFTKVATKVYQGLPAPIVGSSTVFLYDASSFPATGQVYIGRGTNNYEGPITYTAKTSLGTYWSLTFSSGTTKFHNQGEEIVLSQGGNRIFPAGTLATTPQGNVADAVSFKSLYPALIPDGEIEVDGVIVVALTPSVLGNVPAGVINRFPSPPFQGATVKNPLPFSNALSTWSDSTYQEAIRNARNTRTKGTALAVTNGVIGISSPDEQKSVLSASLVAPQGTVATLYVDDGTGYEERTAGVAYESLVDSANGGEQFFAVTAGRPVTKAFVESTLSAPFLLADGMVLTAVVGGVVSTHTFSQDTFRAIGNAAADEVASSINGDGKCLFMARTINGDTQVVIQAIADFNEDIAVVPSATNTVDANSVLGFPAGTSLTMALYKNDVLLSKDGLQAAVSSTPQVTWLAMSSPQTLTVAIDGTPAVTYTFTDSDFVAAQTGFFSLASTNSLASWAAVFNAKIPGITASVGSDGLILSSNLGRASRASILISGGTLESAGKMFSFTSAAGLQSIGRNLDYTLDRNTAQIGLVNRLVAGDKLTAGTAYPRPFVQSAPLKTFTTLAESDLWFVVDGQPLIVQTAVTASTSVTSSEYVTTPPVTWGHRVRWTSASGTFSAVQIGDWAIFIDSAFNAANLGAWRVAYVDGAGAYFEVERSSFVTETVTLSGGGLSFVRTTANLQVVKVPAAANWTAATIVDQINAQLAGASASTYQTTSVRVRTDSATGDIALVAQNITAAATIGFRISSASASAAKLAAVSSAAFEAGTPQFLNPTISTISSAQHFTASGAGGADSGSFLGFGRDLPDTDSSAPRSRYGTNTDFRFTLTSLSGSSFVTRQAPLDEFLPLDRFRVQAPFAVSAADDFAVLIDQDTVSKRYAFSAYRRGRPTSSTYSQTFGLNDLDNGLAPLTASFGTTFNWQDFAVWMRARAKSHAESGDTTKTILWRYYRYGPDGNQVKIRYAYPTAPNQTVAVSSNPNASGFSANSLVMVSLPSGAARTSYLIRNSTSVGVMAATSGSLQTLTYLLGFLISTAVRVIQVDYTGRGTTAFSGVVTGGTSGATGTVVSDSLAGGLSGSGTLTLSAVIGAYISGEFLTGVSTATSARAQYGLTTLTLDVATPGATGHGFSPGNQLWIQSSSGSFSSGLKALKSVTSTTVSYEESNNAVGSTANIGDVSYDSVGETKFAGSSIVTGDVASWGSATGLPAAYQTALRVNVLGSQYLSGPAETATSTGTVPTWYPVLLASAFSAFPINSTNTAAQIATSVNSLTGSPVSAVAVGLGGVATGQIQKASFDEFSTSGYAYSLTDGINSVATNSTPPNLLVTYSFTLKDTVTAGLATNSDWSNDEVRLVPVTAAGVAGLFGTLGVSGLGSVAEVAVDERAGSVQIFDLTLGSSGSVQVQGGSSNTLTAAIIGAATLTSDSTYSFVTTRAVDVAGLASRMWVDVRNTNPMPKPVFTSGTSAVSIDGSGNFVLSGTQAWTYANSGAAPINGFTWQVEQQSRYTCFTWNGVGSAPVLTGINEGDWVVISNASWTLSGRNTGTFRVVRVDTASTSFWVENPNSLPEIQTAGLTFITYASIMPGDKIVIGTPVWGAGNVGTWVVKALAGSVFGFQVFGNTSVFTGPTALGSSSPLVQCLEGTPTKLVKKILSVTQDPIDTTKAQVKFSTTPGYAGIGSAAGSVLFALDKLNFPTSIAVGSDGYAHSVGLIGEAARVLYGDPSDSAAYPGIVAFDSDVNISGPIIRRIFFSLAIRLDSGTSSTSTADIIERVQSAVAAFINSLAVGQSVPISGVVAAASKVNGVGAIAVLSPAYGPGADQIAVQPGEKALVLNSLDTSITLVGG